jgi:hypothetical protein
MTKYIYLFILCIIISLFIYWNYFKNSYNDYVIYIPNFLDKKEYHKLLNTLKKDHRPHDINRNGLLKKTILDQQINDIFYSPKSIQTINKITNNYVMRSKIPIEYRMYQLHNGMDWHKDILLYKKPQYECVYTIKNTSDSQTEYIDHNEKKHSQWTEPNSLMIVRADGYFHHVKPVTRGEREILKLVYTPTSKLNPRTIVEYNQALNGDT